MRQITKALKNQGYILKGIGKLIAGRNRADFEKSLFSDMGSILKAVDCRKESGFELVGFSSKKDFAEQVLSILSFMRYAGRPKVFHLYSDGSHTEVHTRFFKEYLPFVNLYIINIHDANYQLRPELEAERKILFDHASKSAFGKRLILYLNHPVPGPTLFLDSDILFYHLANEMHLLNHYSKGWFLPDSVWGSFDETYISNDRNQLYAVNGGFFKIDQNLNAAAGLNYLKGLNGNYGYFSEQTTVHIMLHDNQLHPLDPRIYLLNNSDEFTFRYNFKRSDIALRHYVNIVRYKMWLRNWKWHLSIS